MTEALAPFRGTAGCGNALLRELAPEDARRLAPEFKREEFRPGSSVFEVDGPLEKLYFPERAIVSVRQQVGSDAFLEVGLIGSEGVVGWPLLLGCARSAHACTVHVRGGSMLSISAVAVAGLGRTCPSLRSMLLRFVHIFTVQISGALVSQTQDRVDGRVSRWLLMRHDRLLGDEIRVFHEDIAANLGVRRAGVTDSLHVLEGDGAVRCRRGSIVIRNRQTLERAAGAAYGTAEAQYSALIGPFGKTERGACVSSMPA